MSGLRTDLYELRMAGSYLRRGMTEQATFSLFVRRLPPRRGFLVAAGLAEALTFLEQFAFDADDLSYLRDVGGFDPSALTALSAIRFTGDVWAVPEGRVVFADEPLLEVTAPIAEAQLVETGVLNLITFHTTIASKAARCRIAAGDAQLIDFAFRRTHGLEAGAGVARASAIAGFAATSDVEAAHRYGLVPSGTMAHSYVEAFPDERSAFRAFATDFPVDPIFLVDTYDTPAGVWAAVDVIRELGLTGPLGVRLDSGDLAALARQTRAILDEAGLPQARIVASGSLDENVIAGLVEAGAPIDGYGVGTKMGVAYDAPSLDSAYKLVCIGDRPVLKLSPGKATLPAPKQVFRDPAGVAGDVVGLRDEPVPAGRESLLVQVMRDGRRLDPADPVEAVRAARRRFDAELSWLPESARRLTEPEPLTATVSPALVALHGQVAARAGRDGGN
ncbi:nicotinate phosphoribosyltransferase [Micromonospora sp. NPDC005367]|uniref:nicotinate phosphoribosyltransferase n=1 Tax=Micromonospora sp. NPDC005367 TaxID=3155590 RepID=UPI0033B555D4